MRLKISLLSVLFLTISLFFACKNDKVTSTGKELGDDKVEKLHSGQPIYDNMEGIWIDRNNPNRKLDLRGGKFKMFENGNLTVDGEFVFYKTCPSGCFPEGMGGNSPGFSVRTANDLRCYFIRELSPDKSIGFVEISANENEPIQQFDRSK